ncbi:hypothetical protein COE67_04840 [Priestia megaterium]|uniref:hypothetical protein n=1 Tax=Priestia megaterium TaxID=1404 RepID=UPI000BFC5431|nr:hypothetical protein [Priestia megaterium]PGX44276.1 hypothetical protein COE67_04840 [Priestia megaterium]
MKKWSVLLIILMIIVVGLYIIMRLDNTDEILSRAYADGKSHPLSKEFSTKEEAIKTYPFLEKYLNNNENIDWKNLEVDFCVINQLSVSNRKFDLPEGNFIINEPLQRDDIRLTGSGVSRTKITQMNPDKPVIVTSGVPYIADIYMGHFSLPQINGDASKGAGIYLEKGLRDGSVLERLVIQNVTSGIYLNENDNVHVYSSSFRDIRVARFSHSAFYLSGSGNTGNVISNIYAVNWNNYEQKTKLKAPYGFVLRGFDEGSVNQLNVEHGLYGKGVVISESNLDLNSIHFEGYVPNENFGSFFYVGGNSNINIRNSSIVHSSFDQNNAKNYSILGHGGKSNVEFNNFKVRGNSIQGTPTLRKFYGIGTIKEGASIYAKNFYIEDKTFSARDYFPISPLIPIVRVFNDTKYFWIEGSQRNFAVSSFDASGGYEKGDVVHIISGNSTQEYVRKSDGTGNVVGEDWVELDK